MMMRRLGMPSARRQDEVLLLEAEHLPANEPRHRRPIDDPDRDRHEQDVLPEHRQDDDHEQQIREGVDHVGDAHQGVIEGRRSRAGDQAHRHA
ncbi:MAG TPA: hypothetical protein VGJ87_16000 [Roseiflexaceae bacterium]